MRRAWWFLVCYCTRSGNLEWSPVQSEMPQDTPDQMRNINSTSVLLFLAVIDGESRQALVYALELKHGDVGAFVGKDDAGVELAPVVETTRISCMPLMTW